MTFKKVKFSPSKKAPATKRKMFALFANKEEERPKTPSVSSRIFNKANKLLSPAPSVEANIGIRPRNRSEATMSIA